MTVGSCAQAIHTSVGYVYSEDLGITAAAAVCPFLLLAVAAKRSFYGESTNHSRLHTVSAEHAVASIECVGIFHTRAVAREIITGDKPPID